MAVEVAVTLVVLKLPPAVAVFAALWMWPEIVNQLGSGETYAMPALALFAWCAVDIVRGTGGRTGLAWLGMTIASLVAIGSKENFVVLAPLTLVVAAVEWRGHPAGTAV